MQIPYLGQRLVDEKGKAGPYHWMTYAEVSKRRTEIGSGLLHYGIKSGSTLGLYSINCRGACLCSLCRPTLMPLFSRCSSCYTCQMERPPTLLCAEFKVELSCRLGPRGVCKRVLLYCDSAAV